MKPFEVREKPVRVLHVVGSMDAGGSETWLMNMLRRIERRSFQFDFLAHTAKPCFFDPEIRSLGASVIPCPDPSRLWRYIPAFLRILATRGPYDIIHSHVHHFSGIPLTLARWAGVPVRIAHSHSDTSEADERSGRLRKCYLRCARRLILSSATHGLGCSGKAADALFAAPGDDMRDPRFQVLYCGVDPAPFYQPPQRSAVRSELRIPEDALVVGHVGRFVEEKNHAFLIELIRKLYRREPRAFLLLVGTGPAREQIEEKAAHLGVRHRISFAGLRTDVPRLMLGAMDCFVLPSLCEGLPLVLLEAQAAGLPCVVSDRVTDEASVIPSLMRKLPLSKTEPWVEQVLLSAPARISPPDAIEHVEKASFTLSDSLKALTHCYIEGLSKAGRAG